VKEWDQGSVEKGIAFMSLPDVSPLIARREEKQYFCTENKKTPF